MRATLPYLVAGPLLALLLAACGGDQSGNYWLPDGGLQRDGLADTQEVVDSGPGDLDPGDLPGPQDLELVSDRDLQGGGDGDAYQGGITCATGDPIVPGDGGLFGIIDPPGDRDHFLLLVDQPTFLSLRTRANPEGLSGKLDTVLSVYDEAGLVLLATSDDSLPDLGADSELLFHAPAAGTYCIKIEDFTTWKDLGAQGGPGFIYKLEVEALVPGVPGLTFGKPEGPAPKPPEQALLAQPFGWRSLMLGQLAAQHQSLAFGLLPKPEAIFLKLSLMPAGPGGPGPEGHPGYGSTLKADGLELRTPGGEVLARVNPLWGMDDLWLPLEAPLALPEDQALEVWVLRQLDSLPGTNDSVSLKADLHAWWNQAEAASATNDDPSSAEPLQATGDSWYITGALLPDSEVDHFVFTVPTPGRLEMGCLAARVGSGLRGARFEIQNPEGTPLQAQAEDNIRDLLWADYPWASAPAIVVNDPGDYLLKVAPGTRDPQVSSSFYQCGIHLRP